MRHRLVFSHPLLDAFPRALKFCAVALRSRVIRLEQKIAHISARKINVRSQLLEDAGTLHIVGSNSLVSYLDLAYDGKPAYPRKAQKGDQAAEPDPKENS